MTELMRFYNNVGGKVSRIYAKVGSSNSNKNINFWQKITICIDLY